MTAKKPAAKKPAAKTSKVGKLLADSKKAQALVEADRKAAPSTAPKAKPAAYVAPATPALDAAAAPKAPTKVAKDLVNDVTPAVVCRRKGQSYTCIRLSIGATHTHYISLATLAVQKAPNREFHEAWGEYPEYPVRRAAELYLGTPHRELEPQARRHLEAIVRDPATVYNLDAMQPKEETTMATATAKKTAPAKKAAPTAAKHPMRRSTDPKPEAKAPAKAANKAPAKQPVKPAAKAPAKAPAKAAKQANGIATVVNGAKPPAKQAAAAAAKPGATRAPNDEKLKVIAPDVPRRGVTGEFQDEAIKLKVFTRQQLVDRMVSKGHDAAAARIKVADMVYFKILAAA